MAQHVDSLRLWEDAQVVGYEKVKRRDGSEELVEVESMGDVVVAQGESSIDLERVEEKSRVDPTSVFFQSTNRDFSGLLGSRTRSDL